MIRLQLNSNYEELLSDNGLGVYQRLMDLETGTLVERNDEREIRYLLLDGTGFYLKRVRREKISAAIERYLSGGLAHGRPYREMQQFRCLRWNGFDVADVVAVGEESRFGLPVSGFIMTREVPGKDLLQWYRQSNKKGRRHIVRHFGALVGKLHRRGFFGSIRLKDVISADEPGKKMTLKLIDRETRNPFPRRPNRNRVLDKFLINFRRQLSQGEKFSRRELKVLTKHYRRALSKSLRLKRRQLLSEIDRLQQRTGPGHAPRNKSPIQ